MIIKAVACLSANCHFYTHKNSEDDLILNMTPEKQDKTSEFSKRWSPDSAPARNEVIMKTTCPIN